MAILPLLTTSPPDALWQRRLRRSVRLYLALQEPDVDAIMAEARLRLVERHLMWHLLHGQPATLGTYIGAQRQVQLAQEALLLSVVEVAAIRQEWSAEQAIAPVPWVAPLAGGWLPTV